MGNVEVVKTYFFLSEGRKDEEDEYLPTKVRVGRRYAGIPGFELALVWESHFEGGRLRERDFLYLMNPDFAEPDMCPGIRISEDGIPGHGEGIEYLGEFPAEDIEGILSGIRKAGRLEPDGTRKFVWRGEYPGALADYREGTGGPRAADREEETMDEAVAARAS
jgi:hypothetical protein